MSSGGGGGGAEGLRPPSAGASGSIQTALTARPCADDRGGSHGVWTVGASAGSPSSNPAPSPLSRADMWRETAKPARWLNGAGPAVSTPPWATALS